ncbi:DcrB-related protein [Niveispirillum sp. BGYR6]|uniref:DcrB-related protein n=1 Tax=Niveispirillum sp. BGYR6 TaxID=2971249 RepID=UPI0022B9A12C|nr:DcrB-related protein [Niveispirillum sp. BGYR6]MDG5493416.1 DcrB-related protein [Niveispirillum sp. BGYR6]
MSQTCRTRDFSFQLPDDWTDRSMIAWAGPSDNSGPVAPNIMVAYDRPRPGEALGAYVNRQMADLSARAQGFQLELRRDVMLSGRQAVEVLFQWNSGAGMVKQRQLYAQLPDGRLISIVNTAPAERFAACDQQFLAMLNSFTWPAPGAAT